MVEYKLFRLTMVFRHFCMPTKPNNLARLLSKTLVSYECYQKQIYYMFSYRHDKSMQLKNLKLIKNCIMTWPIFSWSICLFFYFFNQSGLKQQRRFGANLVRDMKAKRLRKFNSEKVKKPKIVWNICYVTVLRPSLLSSVIISLNNIF